MRKILAVLHICQMVQNVLSAALAFHPNNHRSEKPMESFYCYVPACSGRNSLLCLDQEQLNTPSISGDITQGCCRAPSFGSLWSNRGGKLDSSILACSDTKYKARLYTTRRLQIVFVVHLLRSVESKEEHAVSL